MKMWQQVFLILVLAVTLIGAPYFAEIKKCDSKHEDYIIVPVDKNLFLCCNATNTGTCGTKNQSYSLLIEPQADCNFFNSSTLWNDACSAKAEFYAQGNERNCIYVCRDGFTPAERPYDRLTVFYLYSPPLQKPVQINTSCTGGFNITVSGSPGGSTEFIKKDYGISLFLSNGTRILLYSGTCQTQIDNTTCLFTLNIGSHLVTDDVDISINVSNPVGSNTYNETINLLSYIIPDCVEDLSLFHKSLTSSEAVIKFRPPQVMLRLIPFMSSLGKPLLYDITLIKSNGVAEKIELYMNKTVFNDTDTYVNQYVAVKFQHLKAYMSYTVTVKGRAGGGDGCLSRLTFTTKMAVPAAAPDFENFSFSRPNNSVNSSLLLIWKPLSIDDVGGSNISYDVEVTSVYGYFLRLNVHHAYLAKLSDFPHTELMVKIWSRNEIGTSQNFTQLRIPYISSAVLDDSKLLIDYINKTTALAFFDLPKGQAIQQIVFHWCYKYLTSDSTNQIVCQDHLKSLIINQSPDVNNVTISLASNIDPKEETSTDVFVDYYDFENESQPLVDNKTARATRTVSAYLSVQVQQPVVSECQNKTGDYPRFFMSLKINNSWSGLIPARCHFSRQSKEVQVDFNKNNQNQIGARQQCGTCSPSQFLVRYYRITSVENAECQEKQGSLLVASNLFGETLIQIPLNLTWNWICIYAVRESQSQELKKVELIEHTKVPQEESSFPPVAIVFIVIAVFIVCGLLAYCMIPKCRERKQHFQQMIITTDITADITADITTDEKDGTLKNYPASQPKNSTVYESTESKLDSNMSSVDSGHPTISGSDLDYMAQQSTGQDVTSPEGSSSEFISSASGYEVSRNGSAPEPSSSGTGSESPSSGSGSESPSSGSGSESSSSGSGSESSSSGSGSQISSSSGTHSGDLVQDSGLSSFSGHYKFQRGVTFSPPPPAESSSSSDGFC